MEGIGSVYGFSFHVKFEFAVHSIALNQVLPVVLDHLLLQIGFAHALVQFRVLTLVVLAYYWNLMRHLSIPVVVHPRGILCRLDRNSLA